MLLNIRLSYFFRHLVFSLGGGGKWGRIINVGLGHIVTLTQNLIIGRRTYVILQSTENEGYLHVQHY